MTRFQSSDGHTLCHTNVIAICALGNRLAFTAARGILLSFDCDFGEVLVVFLLLVAIKKKCPLRIKGLFND